MKKILSAILCAVLVCVPLCACSDSAEMTSSETLSAKYTRSDDSETTCNYSDGGSAPSSYNDYITEIEDFEFKLFRSLYEENGSSGSSVTAAVNTALQLGLVLNGASGDTSTEISDVLGSELTLDSINQSSSYFKSRIQAVADSVIEKTDSLSGKTTVSEKTGDVTLENVLFVNGDSDVKTNFLQSAADYYSADIFRFDFSGSDAGKKIDSVFSDYCDETGLSLGTDDKLVSVTASDVYDEWLEPYALTDIEDGEFGTDEGSVSVKFMRSNEVYMKSSSAVGAVKYMASTPLKLVLIMPNEGTSLSDYIGSFTAEKYSELMQSIDYKTKAEVKIPEFSVSSGLSELTSAVEKCGLYSSFTDSADYFEISSSDGFAFSAMYELTPEISVSAAGIGGSTDCDSSSILETRTQALDECEEEITFDRPFIFMLVDNETDLPLYIGVKTD